MKLHIEIDMNGAAFEGGCRGLEVSSILMRIPEKLDISSRDDLYFMDSNGNTCGRAWTTED